MQCMTSLSLCTLQTSILTNNQWLQSAGFRVERQGKRACPLSFTKVYMLLSLIHHQYWQCSSNICQCHNAFYPKYNITRVFVPFFDYQHMISQHATLYCKQNNITIHNIKKKVVQSIKSKTALQHCYSSIADRIRIQKQTQKWRTVLWVLLKQNWSEST